MLKYISTHKKILIFLSAICPKRFMDTLLSSGKTICQKHPTYKVNSTEAAVTDLTEISKQFFWIIFAE